MVLRSFKCLFFFKKFFLNHTFIARFIFQFLFISGLLDQIISTFLVFELQHISCNEQPLIHKNRSLLMSSMFPNSTQIQEFTV